ncbi:hypothetical protein PPACK8108_LOCUS23163 [Phakopsora pachyrhizi]|uniref:Uncharacterized protein n=1 Tax=Phakopsora pachyrhizi TaxID=170000 RepID=A0AAV0BLM7_PHAPC|nr:hypothetical protein PPACK8108_LOCUS23163 [Phakopsora pachyrhizi]
MEVNFASHQEPKSSDIMTTQLSQHNIFEKPPLARYRLSLPQISDLLKSTQNDGNIFFYELRSARRRTVQDFASNESIRTAKPICELELDALTPTDFHRTFRVGNHPEASTSAIATSEVIPPRFENIRVFDLFCKMLRDSDTSAPTSDIIPSTSPVDSLSYNLGPSHNKSPLHAANSILGTPSSQSSPRNFHLSPTLSSRLDMPFVIWEERKTDTISKSSASVHNLSKKTLAGVTDRYQQHHSPAASTSHLGLDNTTSRLSQIPNKSATSINFSSTTGSGRRWSRTMRAAPSSSVGHQPDSALSASPRPGSSVVYSASASTSTFGTPSEEHHPLSSVSVDEKVVNLFGDQKVLMAATIERWVSELTTRIDSGGLMEFFLTYRTVMKPLELCKLLGSRFEWSIIFRGLNYCRHALGDAAGLLNQAGENRITIEGRVLRIDASEESERRIVKVRTFVMIRHWIVHHYEDDFLRSEELRTELINWLKNLSAKIKRVQRLLTTLELSSDAQLQKESVESINPGGEEDLRILKNLRRVLRDQQGIFLAHKFTSKSKPSPSSKLPEGTHRNIPDVRGLWKDKDQTDQTFQSRSDHPRSQDLSLVDRKPRKSSLSYVTRESFSHKRGSGTLGQVPGASVAMSDLRLCEVNKHCDEPGSDVRSLETDHQDETSTTQTTDYTTNYPTRASDSPIPDKKLISSLDKVFALNTRCSHSYSQSKKIANDSNPLCIPVITSRRSAPVSAVARDQSPALPSRAVETNPNLGSHHLSKSASHTGQSHHAGSSFPQHHNPIHRYFTSTMGTIGRFRRMIHNRSTTTGLPSHSTHPIVGGSFTMNQFSMSVSRNSENLEMSSNEVGDLLCAKGRLERYLSFFELEEEESEVEGQGSATIPNLASISGKRLVSNKISRIFAATDESDAEIHCTRMNQVLDASHDGQAGKVKVCSSPLIQCDEQGFESQVSLSSSASHTTCTSQSVISEDQEDANEVAITEQDNFTGPRSLDLHFGRLECVKTPEPPHELHESLSAETIKSESNPIGRGVGSGMTNSMNEIGISILKKNMKKKLFRKEISSVGLLKLDEANDRILESPLISDMFQPDEAISQIDFKTIKKYNSTSHFDINNKSEEKSLKGVQLDDLELSDSDEEWPNGRKLRRLPGTTDLKQALGFGRKSIFNLKANLRRVGANIYEDGTKRLSSETSSSIGTRRVPSIAASMFRRSKLSALAMDKPEELPVQQAEEAGITVVANFVADGLESDDDEPGDVEAALRRLEGVIDADREREKARKVELQMMKSVEASRRTRSSSRATQSSVTGSSSSSLSLLIDNNDSHLMAHEEQSDSEIASGEMNTEDEADSNDEGDCLPPLSFSMRISEGDEEEEDRTSSRTPTIPSVLLNLASCSPELSSTPEIIHPAVSIEDLGPVAKQQIKFSPDPNFVAREKGLLSPKNGAKVAHRQPFKKSKTANKDQVISRKSSIRKLFAGGSTAIKVNSSRVEPSSARKSNLRTSLILNDRSRKTISENLALIPPLPPVHRSFLLDCRTEILAQQFCLIERDLLRNITWQELLLSRWQEDRSFGSSKRRKGGALEVNCWETFMKERAKEKMKLKSSPKDGLEVTPKWTEVKGLIMRFNLTCNWVASEIVLSVNLDERVMLLGKFIRLAFNNFQTLTQIIHGLQTPYVERLRKTWSKLGIWETRMFRDLRAFTSHTSNFKSMRNMQDNLVEQMGLADSSLNRSAKPKIKSNHYSPESLAGVGSGSRSSHTYTRGLNPVSCIPFLGLYLRDLTVNDELPTYLDPSDPSVPAKVDPKTGLLTELAKPEAFNQLSTSLASDGSKSTPIQNLTYYPLINIHKLRTYSRVVQKIQIFQESGLNTYQFEADQKWFLICLKIKSLDSDQLRRLSKICEP